MPQAQQGDHTWVKRRFGTDAWAELPSKRRAVWYVGGLCVSLLLLMAFYLVLQQSLIRANQHWSQASRADPCLPRGGSGSEVCASGIVSVRSPVANPR